jgi:hypothetical protein
MYKHQIKAVVSAKELAKLIFVIHNFNTLSNPLLPHFCGCSIIPYQPAIS